VHDEVEGELSGRACGPGKRPPGERHVQCAHARRVAGPAFPLVWARCTGEKRGGGSTAGLTVHGDVTQASVRRIGLHSPRGRPAD
jgi:hypothetical protein